MDAIEMLASYKSKVDPFLEEYFQKKFIQAQKVDSLSVQAVKILRNFTLSGGKRIRPALVYYGYLAAGGRNCREIVEASMSIELAHSFLLIHDDIIDRDEKRHGGPTIHETYRKIGQKMNPMKDSRHFGNSMAIVAGDMANAMGYEIIFNLKFQPKVIIKALNKLQDIISAAIPGEMLDVVMGNRGHATEKEVLRMFEGKTSRYTFEGPLHLGCVLAEGDAEMIEKMTAYSLPLGKAFQIRDDILGVFGNEKKLGKPVGSDISEGKQTLLLVQALRKGDNKQKKALKRICGKEDLTPEELEEFKQIIRETGALEYSQNLAKKLVAESLEALDQIKFKNQKAELFLRGIADYIVSREV